MPMASVHSKIGKLLRHYSKKTTQTQAWQRYSTVVEWYKTDAIDYLRSVVNGVLKENPHVQTVKNRK